MKGESMDSFYGDLFIDDNWDDNASSDKIWVLCGSSDGTTCVRQKDVALFAEYNIDTENLYRDRNHVYTIVDDGNTGYICALVDLCGM